MTYLEYVGKLIALHLKHFHISLSGMSILILERTPGFSDKIKYLKDYDNLKVIFCASDHRANSISKCTLKRRGCSKT